MPPKTLLRKFFNLFIFASLVIIFYLIIFYLNSLFRIKNIIIVSEKKNTINFNGLRSLENQLIFFINEYNIKKDFIQKNPHLEDINIKKKLPNTIVLTHVISNPIAQIQVANGFFHLSKKGRILKKTKNKIDFLPLIIFYQKFNYQSYPTGDYLKYSEIIYSLKAIEKIKSLGFNNIKEVKIKNSNLIICYFDNKEINLSAEKDIERTFYELTTIINKIKLEKKDFQKLDVRFNKPIIVFL